MQNLSPSNPLSAIFVNVLFHTGYKPTMQLMFIFQTFMGTSCRVRTSTEKGGIYFGSFDAITQPEICDTAATISIRSAMGCRQKSARKATPIEIQSTRSSLTR